MSEEKAPSRPHAPRTLALVADPQPEFRATLAAVIRSFDPSAHVVEAAAGSEARTVLLCARESTNSPSSTAI
jgi:hypothetical protein